MPKVVVCIPSYKAPDKLKKCIEHIEKQTKKCDHYVFENSGNNKGYTYAINDMVKRAIKNDYDYAITLNQDCYLRPDCIEKAVEFMEEHPNCFIGGFKQLLGADEDIIVHAGCETAFPNGVHKSGRVSNGDHTKSSPSPWVTGAATIVRLDLVPDVGLMDPNYFLISSDADWCYTARLRGFECWYIADAVCVHEIGVSGRTDTPFQKEKRMDQIYGADKWYTGEAYRNLEKEVF